MRRSILEARTRAISSPRSPVVASSSRQHTSKSRQELRPVRIPCLPEKLCDLFGKSAFALGLAAPEETASASSSATFSEFRPPSNPFARYFERDIELRLQCLLYDWQQSSRFSHSYALLQHRLCQELEDDDSMTNEPKQHHNEVDIGRRDALRRLALLPIHVLGLDALGATPSWAPEEVLTHCAAGVTACEQLSKGLAEDMNLAYGVLTTYLAPLKEIVERSSLHRQEAARLVAQALLIKATLSVHREGPKRAASSGKQAEIFSRESGDVPLRLAILKRLAWMYACDKQDKRALEAVLQAQSLLEEQQNKGKPIHPFVRSRVLGGVAEYHALNGKDEEALVALSERRCMMASQRFSSRILHCIGSPVVYRETSGEHGLSYTRRDGTPVEMVLSHPVDVWYEGRAPVLFQLGIANLLAPQFLALSREETRRLRDLLNRPEVVAYLDEEE